MGHTDEKKVFNLVITENHQSTRNTGQSDQERERKKENLDYKEGIYHI